VKYGENYLKKGEFSLAIDSFQRALNLARKEGNQQGQVKCLMRLGILYWNIGQLKVSLDRYSEALSLAQKLNLRKWEEECRIAIEIYNLYMDGKNYRSSGQYQKSVDCFKKAIDLSKKIESKEHEVKCLRQLSLTFWESNNIEEFFGLNERALRISYDLNHRREEGRCLNNVGIFYFKTSNYSMALKYYEDALSIAQYFDDKTDQSNCLNNLGYIYIDIGNYDKAIEYLTNAQKIDRSLGDDASLSAELGNIGIAYRNKGVISENKGDFYKALDCYNESLRLARKNKDKKTETHALNNIGFLYSNLGNYDEALRYFQLGNVRADETQDIETKSIILNNIGIVYFNQGHYDESIKYYQKAIDLALKIGGRQILWEAYFGLGQCYEKKNDFSLAIDWAKKAIDVIDRIRSQIFIDTFKVGFVKNKLKVYEFLIDLLHRKNLTEPSQDYMKEIFHIIERAKARAFLESLGEAKTEIMADLSPALRKRENIISSKISFIISELSTPGLFEEKRLELLKELEQQEDEYARLISEMRVELPEKVSLISPEPYQVEDVQQRLLDDRTAVLEYFLGENRSYLFFIRKNAFDLYALPSRERIEASIKGYLKVVSAPTKEDFKGILAAKRLFGELLFPLKEKCKESIENLIIIPDGTLYYLPFETLKPDIENKSASDEYLIHKYKISYVPSSSALLFLREKENKQKNSRDLLALGDPVYELKAAKRDQKHKSYGEVLRELYLDQGFDFSPLPYSKKEVLKISRYFSKSKKDIYWGKQAKEEILKRSSLKDYQIIHFACHGFLDEKFPFRSALVLSLDGDKEEDGFLQVREIYNLRLNAELVVLSACQTGKGSLEKGEGILGLPRIFFYAGAKSVLSTLWIISDKSTSLFMDYFYRFLAEGNEINQALRLAKLKMLNSKFSHPFYWAGFVLSGNFNSRLAFE